MMKCGDEQVAQSIDILRLVTTRKDQIINNQNELV